MLRLRRPRLTGFRTNAKRIFLLAGLPDSKPTAIQPRKSATMSSRNTRTRQLNGTPYGSPNWQAAYGGISMSYLNGHIRDAQPGVKYIGDEQSGGYDARRYDFDLTGIDADIKKAMELGNSVGMRQTKDYNVKGSAWIAKDDGRMVKFSFDNIYTFSDGKTDSTHFEGTVTKK